MLIYSFYYFTELTNVKLDRLLTFTVKVGVSFVIVNTVLYFVELPIWKPDSQLWWGRISRGYPTMDVVSLSYVVIILLYFQNLKINLVERQIYLFVIFLGILLQASGTGIVLIICILFFSVLYFVFFKSSTIFKTNLFSIGTLIFMLFFIFPEILNKYYPEEYKKILVLIENKTNILFGNKVDHDTWYVRKIQYEKKLQKQNTVMKKIFGIGQAEATFDAKKAKSDSRYIFIERQYSLNNICYGYIGSTFYIMFIVLAILETILMKQITWNIKMLFCLCILIFVINSQTLIVLVLFPNTAFFAFLYATLKRVKNDHKYYLCNFYSNSN
jgi:hypothetical protein